MEGNDGKKRKRGRPAGEITRKRNCRVSLSDDEFDRVDRLGEVIGKTKADIFREAYKIYENLELSKLPSYVADRVRGGEKYDDYVDYDEEIDEDFEDEDEIEDNFDWN